MLRYCQLSNALCLLPVAHLVTGFRVAGFGTALVAALVVGLINSTLGLLLKLVTLPLTILTFGLFLLVTNALMLWLAASLVPRFEVAGFVAALLGAILLAAINTIVRATSCSAEAAVAACRRSEAVSGGLRQRRPLQETSTHERSTG